MPSTPVSVVGAHLKGRPDAPLAIVEYAEFQCPYCADFVRDTLPSLSREYLDTGKAFMAFRHLPLESIHSDAATAAVAAECAGRQGAFWQMHDRLFDIQRELRPDALLEQIRRLGLSEELYVACAKDGEVLGRVRESAAEARAVGITGTPTFLIGPVQADGRVKAVKRVSGAQPFAVFDEILRALLDAH